MNEPIVIIGIGELGGVFARGFLRSGHPVYPITRGMDISRESRQIPAPCLVLVIVAENELHPVLEQLPEPWRTKVGLMQNELLPGDWIRHNIRNPTVTVVWFEKKKGQPLTNILYTPVYGPEAHLLAKVLTQLDIPSRILENEQDLLYELVRKTVYILTVNICGLVTGGTVGELWDKHQPLAKEVAGEIIAIQQWLTGCSMSREKLIAGMVEGIKDRPDRNCVGRRALMRLQRSLGNARDAGIATPRLTEIHNTIKHN